MRRIIDLSATTRREHLRVREEEAWELIGHISNSVRPSKSNVNGVADDTDVAENTNAQANTRRRRREWITERSLRNCCSDTAIDEVLTLHCELGRVNENPN